MSRIGSRSTAGFPGPGVFKPSEGAPICSGRDRQVQAWRAWAGCGDGGQVHLIIDSPARQIWLWPADEPNSTPRSVQ